MLKWTWLGGMMFVVACLLPAVAGGQSNNRPWSMAGWEMGYMAHAAVWGFSDGSVIYVRRIRPLTESQALCVAGAAVVSNWLMVASCLMAYIGYRVGNPRKWAAYAARAAAYAALLGIPATMAWVLARNLSLLVGGIVWCGAPMVLGAGRWRLGRRVPPGD